MSHNLQPVNGTDSFEPALEERLRRAAGALAYPPTPNLAARERARLRSLAEAHPAPRRVNLRLQWVVIAVVALLVAVIASPIRARVVEWLQLGAVRLFFEQPTLTPMPTTALDTATPTPTLAPPQSLLELSGRTTLDEAAGEAGFPLRLPAYPADLGLPQLVYHQEIQGTPVVILVWLEEGKPDQVAMALYQVGASYALFEKRWMRNVQETTVNQNWALWAEGPYELQTITGERVERRIVEGRTLIWTEGDITYRLESDLSLEEARRAAESLQPYEP